MHVRRDRRRKAMMMMMKMGLYRLILLIILIARDFFHCLRAKRILSNIQRQF